MTDTKKEIARLEKELEALKLKQTKFDTLPEDIQLATTLHSMLCTYNHTDGCGWYYKEHDWTDDTHGRYLAKARKMISFSKEHNVKTSYLIELTKMLREY